LNRMHFLRFGCIVSLPPLTGSTNCDPGNQNERMRQRIMWSMAVGPDAAVIAVVSQSWM
jgi:hypothetical protein